MTESFLLLLIRHRRSVLALSLLWGVIGVWLAWHTPVDAVPDLSDNQVLVHTNWPGHDPLDIERQLTRPLSQHLQGIAGARTVRGSSDVGLSLIHVLFDSNLSFATARQRVRERLLELPQGLPEGVQPQLAAEGIPIGQIYWYTVEGADTDLVALRTLQETVIAPRLSGLAGVAEVATVGGFRPEFEVTLDEERLRPHQLTPEVVTTALQSLTRPRTTGQLWQAANAEYALAINPPPVVGEFGPQSSLRQLQQLPLPLPQGGTLPLAEVATIRLGVEPRRGAFEKDGSEVVAGVVHLRVGFNPLRVTQAIRQTLRQLTDELPPHVRIVPCYDRTPLILGGIETVSRSLLESMLITMLCVVLVLKHWRTSLVIVLTLPLAVLGSFIGMSALRGLGVADVQTNIMSLAGIVVSIGVLVDSSIVVAENVVHELRRHFGDQPVTGDVSAIVARACATVGRPAFLAVIIMLVSFLPVFTLSGIDGQMYRPLAWTKTLALLSSAVLTITLVPVLCATLIQGRLRDESDSWIVRSVVSVYRPVLTWLLDRPYPLVLMLAITLILGATVTGSDWLVRCCVCIAVGVTWWFGGTLRTQVLGSLGLLGLALVAEANLRPLGLALRLPLDEGMVMDMPITTPRINLTQGLDDLKARNMVLCRFPEVRMVSGKIGRAETPFDPAPLDMIETMVEFQPHERWPARRLLPADARRQVERVLSALIDAKLVEVPAAAEAVMSEVIEAGSPRFDGILREVCWQRLQSVQRDCARELPALLVRGLTQRMAAVGALTRPLIDSECAHVAGVLDPADGRRLAQGPEPLTVRGLLGQARAELIRRGWCREDFSLDTASFTTELLNTGRQWFGLAPRSVDDELTELLQSDYAARHRVVIAELNRELPARAATVWTQIAIEELLTRVPIMDDAFAVSWQQVLAARYSTGKRSTQGHSAASHHHLQATSALPLITPHAIFHPLVSRLTDDFTASLWLWPHDQDSLTRPGGELDVAVRMPGWANVWTKPIQNRVDMLATGVNSEVGIRVLGRDLDQVVRVSESLAEELCQVPGAENVLADPIRGKGYLTIGTDAQRLRDLHIDRSALTEWLSSAASGRVVTQIDDGIRSRGVRLRLNSASPANVNDWQSLPVPPRLAGLVTEPLPLREVATVQLVDGPATIKSENGWLRNYVRLNVRGRDPAEFVRAAQSQLRQQVQLPPGVFLEWTGQYEHAAATRRMLLWMIPVVVLLILAILYLAFRDWGDAGLMLLSVPGALAGGILCQWWLGFPFSVAVGVGYIACFGMAAATSMVMLVYLREAVAQAGGLEAMSLDQLRAAVLSGAVHRLRPKLLTEATTILSLAPMLWSTGVGADVIRPMAAPVLGGILIADEVVDLLLPVAFYVLRRHRWRQLHHFEGSMN